MNETDEQTRSIRAIVEDPSCGRAEVRPLADGSREVWCFRPDGVLGSIYTVFRGGNYGRRPGWRVVDS